MLNSQRKPRRNRMPGRRPGAHHAPRRLQAEWLEARWLLAAVPENLEWQLRELVAAQAAEPLMGPALPSVPLAGSAGSLLRITPVLGGADLVGVKVWTRMDPAGLVEPLAQLGLELQDYSQPYHVIEGQLPVTSLAAAAGLPGVLSITPAYRPVTRIGSVTSQGDEILNADEARLAGFDGTGVKVGVMSDSVNSVGGGLATSIASGDLPGPGNPLGNTTPVEVLRDVPGGSDEGRAMLEIVHDLAPGADLAFHTAWYGQLDFANGIRTLAKVGCDVIVDDVIYFDEPWFQDGIIGQAINEASDVYGATYVSAAGNDAGNVHDAMYRNADGWHDFDPSAGVDTALSFTVPAGALAIVVLQWSDPWYTTDGVTNNFDLYVYDQSSGSPKSSKTTNNLATQQPMEWIEWLGSPYVPVSYDVKVQRVAGSGPVELKLWAFSGQMNEYNDGASVLGHAAAAEAIAVGAVPFYSPDAIEAFSSTGPVNIYYDSAGTPLPSAEVRQRPDVVATDQVNTTFFGQDIPEDGDTSPNFSGTSASAPHVAAVAALMLDANATLKPRELRTVLTGTATDLGTGGWDGVFGSGRVDALAAVQQALAMPDSTGPRASFISPPASTSRHVRFATIQFDEPVTPAAATTPANYELRGAGADATFGTGDDVLYTLDPAYDAVHRTVTLDITALAAGLPVGRYRWTVGTGITDEAGNPLNNGSSQTFAFAVTPWSDPVPLAPGYYTVGENPDVAVNANGRAAMVWHHAYDAPGPGSANELALASYDENEALIAGPIVLDDPYSTFSVPAVAVAADGSVVVAHDDRWEAQGSSIYASRFAPDGRFLGRSTVTGVWAVNNLEDVAWLPGGEFVVSWWRQDWPGDGYVFFRVFNADGTAKGDPVEVDPGYVRKGPTVAADGSGNFVITWTRNSHIYAQRFDRQGTALGTPFQVDSTEGVSPGSLKIAMADGGHFVIAWHVAPVFVTPTMHARRFAADGTPLGDQFLVATGAAGTALAMTDDGRFVIGWHGAAGDGRPTGAAYAQRYDAAGAAVGDPFQILAASSTPSLGMDQDGSFLVAWVAHGILYHRWFVVPLPERPDLQAAAVAAPPVATLGEHIELHSTVYNHGIASSAAFQMQYYLSPDAEITGGDNDRALLASPINMAAMWGGTSQANTSYTIVPADLTPGSYWLGGVADVANSVSEEDETNNAYAIPIELAAAPAKTGPEFLANTTTSGAQGSPCVVTAPDGTYTVIWSGKGPGDDQGVFMQRFSATQVPLGSEQRISQSAGSQSGPSVAADPAGNFVVVWNSLDEANRGHVYLRRYTADGIPLEGETVVADDAADGSAALAANGDFVVAWSSLNDVYVRLYDSTGVPATDAFVVSPPTSGERVMPSIAMMPTGSFVVAWRATNFGVCYRVFDADGTPVADEQQVESNTLEPYLAADESGRTFMVWRHWGTQEIHGQWLTSGGDALGSVFTVNSYESGSQWDPPHVTSLDAGGYLVTWVSLDGSNYGIYGQRYSSDGQMTGGEWLINTFTTGTQSQPVAAGWTPDSFVVAWTSAGQDGSGNGVYGQVFGGPAVGPGDLGVFEVAPLRASYEGQTVPASALMRNRGPSTLGTFSCQYYLSVDRSITPSDVPLGSPFAVTQLGAWQAYSDSRTLTLPDTLGGVFYIGLLADIGNQLAESREDNNALASLERGVIGPLPDALGTEFQINGTASGNQQYPVAVRLPDDSFVVAWEGNGTGDDSGIYLRRFNRLGQPLSEEIRANTYTTGRQGDPAIAADPAGNFIVVWESQDQDGGGYGIYGQRFDATAQAQGSELAVNTGTDSDQFDPDVAVDALGNFTVVWCGPDTVQGKWVLRARQFDAFGQPLASDIQLAATASGRMASPGLAMRPSGEFVAVWEYGDLFWDAFAQRFAADASPVGSVFQLDDSSPYGAGGVQTLPAIGMSADGQFVIAWRPGGVTNIYARRYGADGVALTGDFAVNTDSAYGDRNTPRVSVDPDGAFVIVWQVEGQDGSGYGVYGKRYAANGATLEGEFPINTTRSGVQSAPVVAAAGAEDFLVVWQSENVDGSGYAVCAQVIGAPALAASTAQAWPYAQGFESGDPGTLDGWTYAQTGTGVWQVTGTNSPHGGAYHLQASQTTAGGSAEQAVLKLDLSSVATRTDLELDFWLKHLATAASRLSLSADGTSRSWLTSYLINPPSVDQQTRFTFDLDAILGVAGIALDEDVYVKFWHAGSSTTQVMTLDDLRVNDADVFGPRVISQAPGAVAAPVSAVEVTFDEPIDAATFTATDVTVTGPATNTVALAGDPVDAGDHRTFTISLASPLWTGGIYSLALGPEIRDPLGNLMNQDRDMLNGESNGHDTYQGTFQVLAVPAPSLPRVEGFESGAIGALPAWSLARTVGRIEVSTVAVHTGQYALRMGYDSITYSSAYYQEAILHVNLAGRSKVTLDFWANGGASQVTISPDGTSWTLVGDVSTGAYQRYAFDLDRLGVAYTADTQVRFKHDNTWYGWVALDDIRVATDLDVFGARVDSQSPMGTLSSPVSEIELTFSEDIDASSFTPADVTLLDPGANAVPLRATDPIVDSGDHRTFTIYLASAQSLGGQYTLSVGPEVLDLSGNAMNQNNDAVHGDGYSGGFDFVAQPAAPPVLEGFEGGSFGGLGAYWSFLRTSGTITVSNANPHTGQYALQMGNSSGTILGTDQDAILHMDLLDGTTPLTGATVDFWVKEYGAGMYSGGEVSVSMDGMTWTTPSGGSIAGSGTWEHYAFNLDALGLAYSDDVQIRFRHGTYSSGYFAWDDIRVATGLDVFGPRVTGQVPTQLANDGGPLTTITLTFSEAIDVGSFDGSDVVLKDPRGVVVTPVTVAAVAGSGGTQFTLSFAAQDLRGDYRLAVGPDVRDVAGNQMDQNQDSLQGTAADMYSPMLPFSAAPVFPIQDGLEDASLGTHWYLSSAGTGTIQVVASGSPHSGTKHLLIDQPAATSSQWAAVYVDLTGHVADPDLWLDFWAKWTVGGWDPYNQTYVEFSADGQTWQQAWTGDMPTSWTRYLVDLDQAFQGKLDLAVTPQVYLRVRQQDTWNGSSLFVSDLYLDDVQVRSGDAVGARVTSQIPTGTVDGPLAAIQVTFNEDIDVSNFTAGDVTLTDPGGNGVPLDATEPIRDSGDHRTFTLRLATPQSLGGSYALSVGPDVLDLAGNVMNQNGDVVQGDGYSGSVTLNVIAAMPPFIEGFEAGQLGQLGAAWTAVRNAGTAKIGTANPVAGNSAVEMSSAGGSSSYYQDLILHVDLAGQTAVVLDYWLKEISGGGRSDDFSVAISTNGTTWVTPAALTTAGSTSYQHFGLDLDSVGLTYSNDVRIKFHHNNYYAGSFALDGVRVRANALPVNHAPTLTTITTLTGATKPQPFEITYDALATAANEADVDGDSLSFRIMSVTSGTLTKDGVAVDPGSTLLGAGESVVWTPVNAGSAVAAFTVRAWDGDLDSGTSVPVTVAVTPADGALSFDGGNDYAKIPNATTLNPAQLTVECWVKFGQLAASISWAWLVGKGSNSIAGNYLLAQGGSNRNFVFELTPYYNNWMVFGGSNLETNRWYHVAGTYDGQDMKLYVDGVLQASKTVGAVTIGTTDPLYFGCFNGSGYFLNGALDDVRVWNYARTADEIRSALEPHLTGDEPGLMAYWELNEAIISQAVLDKTANANHGVLGSTTSVETNDPARIEHPHPTADIVDVTPDPRSEPVGVVTVDFSEAVTGVDIADFHLTRDGSPVDLSGLTVTPVTAARYTLDLTTVTAVPGSYVLTLVAGGSGIRGIVSSYSAFCEDASETWREDTLQVTGLMPAASGFVATFNGPLDTTVLNLYDGAGGALGAADVVVLNASGQNVAGSLIVAADLRTITWVATGDVLPAGPYTVTLTSGATAWHHVAGYALDGDADGISGGDFTTTFTVASPPSGTVVVSTPDFARGAAQPVNIPNTASGLPIRLSDATGVTSLAVDLVYDQDLLEITAATLAAGLPGDWTVVNPPDISTPGVAKIRASGTTALSGTNVEVVRLTAAVPPDAPYGAVQAIRLENVSLNGGAIAAVGDVAVHKAVYLGDADGSGIHSSADAFLTVQAALGLASGFAAHAWTDPRIVGDADASGVLSAADAFLIVQEGLGLSEPFVPDNPHITVTHVGGGVDPQFRIGVAEPASVGGVVTVPVKLAIEPAATNVGAFDFDLFFDPGRLTIDVPGGVSAGADTAGGWAISARLLDAGLLRVGMISSGGQPLVPGMREIVRLQFRVEAGVGSAAFRRLEDDRLEPALQTPGYVALDIEPVDARAGGYTWTDADGSVLIRPAVRALAVAWRDRVWRDMDAKAELLESVLADVTHEIASAWR